jgi:hypothetical protein
MREFDASDFLLHEAQAQLQVRDFPTPKVAGHVFFGGYLPKATQPVAASVHVSTCSGSGVALGSLTLLPSGPEMPSHSFMHEAELNMFHLSSASTRC